MTRNFGFIRSELKFLCKGKNRRGFGFILNLRVEVEISASFGGSTLQHPVGSDGVDSGPLEQCGSTTSLDDHCLVAGISCLLQNISHVVLQRLLETILTQL